MNYTEEVLLRQQLALAVLMGGGAGRKTETVEQKEKSWANGSADEYPPFQNEPPVQEK